VKLPSQRENVILNFLVIIRAIITTFKSEPSQEPGASQEPGTSRIPSQQLAQQPAAISHLQPAANCQQGQPNMASLEMLSLEILSL